MAVKRNLLLYADDTCLVYQNKNVRDIKKHLNEDFANICDWFVDHRQVFTSVKIKLRLSFSLLNLRSESFRSYKLYITVFK